MLVFIEYAIIENFIVDYVLLKYSLSAARIKTSLLRLTLSSLLGTATAIALPLVSVNKTLIFLIKILAGEGMVFSAGRYKDVLSFCKAFLYFLLFTFSLGGILLSICLMIWGSAALDKFQTSGEASLLILLATATLFPPFVKRMITHVKRLSLNSSFERKIALFDGGKSVLATCYIDTGNKLIDVKTDKPIAIIDKKLGRELILSGFFQLNNSHYVFLSTVSKTAKILVFEIEKIVIYSGEDRNIINNVMVGISPSGLNNGIDVLLGPSMLAGEV